METTTSTRSFSVFGLLRSLTGDTKTFIRQEIQLAKTELSEKISAIGKNAVTLAIGGFVAYAGLIVLLMGLGWLIAYAFQRAGLDPAMAGFLGLSSIGLLVVVIGCILLLKGVKSFSKTSLAPQRTIHTLQELRGHDKASEAMEDGEEDLSSEDMQHRVEATESRMGDTLDELGYRLSPSHINSEVKKKVSENPYRFGLLAMAAGVISGLVIRRRMQT